MNDTDFNAPPPAIVLWFLAIGVPAIMLGISMVYFFVRFKSKKPDATAGGMKLFFEPKELGKEFNPKPAVDFFENYASVMPEAFALIGVKTNKAEVLKTLGAVVCTFKAGYLSSAIREKTGLDDLDGDGKKDKLSGLTHSPTKIEISVLPEKLVAQPGGIQLVDTAFCYEAHNAVIWALASYEVAMGEAFVSADDKRVIPWLNGKSLSDMKSKRQVLDRAYESVKIRKL